MIFMRDGDEERLRTTYERVRERKSFGLTAISNPLLGVRCRVARWVANWRRHAQHELVCRELNRLSEFQLNDIGVTRSPRREIKLDMGRGVLPAVIMEFEYRQRGEKSQDNREGVPLDG
ncbi:MAG: DUF1127 domain-containing protein [Mesorhizobium sp.]|uniref:DUF1127 domain-containing protein n=2 Tax=Mesorhizobium sp. TaxID=1871066 RepID=UPI000FE4FC0B|nr:MAG: DUF1127 domain-containing protein [Mesorhizobium sp.]RWC60892.1 MAG: DUF1127 domain-containing protein [Mesorhizobium sp.]